jgi:hypothetical protein
MHRRRFGTSAAARRSSFFLRYSGVQKPTISSSLR